jgi:hypothetical protein
MTKQTHILNGDSLKNQFPTGIQGDIIVTRECLVDGSVKGDHLETFYQTRAHFISDNYAGHTTEDYFKRTVSEFEKMKNIGQETDINLWFEDDLFCQVNFWFVLNFLAKFKKTNPTYLVRPNIHTPYGFSGLSETELISIYKTRTRLTAIDKLSSLWVFYANDETEELLRTAKELENKYPFILPAVTAHIQQIPDKQNPGRPVKSLVQIMHDLETKDFGLVFKEFNRREFIYGFGDLQVKRLFDTLQNKK